MRILVTGASGLVGGNLARALALRGDEVVALLRDGSKAPALDDVPHQRAPGDVRDRASVERALEGCEGLVHAAAVASLWGARAAEIEEVNVGGARNVLEAALARGVRRAVHIGALDALGLPEGRAVTEDEPDGLPLMPGPYAAAKRRADTFAREIAARGLPVSIIAPGFVIGPWDSKPSSGRMIVAVARGVPVYTSGSNVFVAAADVVAAVLSALERGVAGRTYLVAPHNLTWREAFTRVARVLGVRPPWLAVPRPVALAVGALGSAAQTLLRRELDVNLITAESGYRRRTVTSTRARDELGIGVTPFETAVEDAARWLRERGYF